VAAHVAVWPEIERRRQIVIDAALGAFALAVSVLIVATYGAVAWYADGNRSEQTPIAWADSQTQLRRPARNPDLNIEGLE
jgi:hypothetical protein